MVGYRLRCRVSVAVVLAVAGSALVGLAPVVAAAVAPSVSAISPATGSTNGGTRITLTGTGFRHVRSVVFGTVKGTSVTVVSSTRLRVTAPAHAAGVVSVRVHTASGVSALRSGDRFTYIAPPSISAVSPVSGRTSGGTRVTVTGARFRNVTAVKFGSSSGTSIKVLSSTRLQVTDPAHGGGLVAVRVSTRYGTSPAVNADHFTYVAPPAVTGVAPSFGITAGGTHLTITGTDFSHVTGVSLGGLAASGLVVTSPTSLTVNTPAHGIGKVDVRISTADQ
jgi:hypothetical protein